MNVPAKVIERSLQAIALSAIAILALITIFIFREGTPILVKTGIGHFLFGGEWQPLEGRFGILPMIVGSTVVTAGALAIGVLPAARSGIIAAVILGMGRAVGETMAVIMVAGNSVRVPHSPLDPVRTLTANIALEMGYAAGDHASALFATAIVLFVIIMVLNT